MTQNPFPPVGALALSGGLPGLCRTLHAEVREPDTSTSAPNHDPAATPPASPGAILDFVASDESLDRYGEVIQAGGWQLDNYRRNPVFQNAHQYGDILFTLGRALITEIRSGTPTAGGAASQRSSSYLYQRIQFAVEANPVARIAYDLYRGKFLNAVSVGFIPIRWQDADGQERSARSGTPDRSARSEADFAARSFRRRYLQQELLEVSAVGIPANPNALVQACQDGAVERSDLRELADFLRGFLRASRPASAPDASRPLDAGAAFPSWLSLAHQLQRLLRRS